MPSKRKKNEARKAKKEGRRESEKYKSRLLCHSKFCFLRMPGLRKLIFCIWIRRPRSVRPVNRFVVSFSSLQHDSDQKTTRIASKHVFLQNLQERMGKYICQMSKDISLMTIIKFHSGSNQPVSVINHLKSTFKQMMQR